MNIYLKKNQERRLLTGHLWVFSNEIEKIDGEIINGGICNIYSSRNRFIGRGYYNKHSLIAARILTYGKEEINYELAFYRDAPFSVRNYGDEPEEQ